MSIGDKDARIMDKLEYDYMKVTLFSEEGGKQSKHEQASSEEDIISNRHK